MREKHSDVGSEIPVSWRERKREREKKMAAAMHFYHKQNNNGYEVGNEWPGREAPDAVLSEGCVSWSRRGGGMGEGRGRCQGCRGA